MKRIIYSGFLAFILVFAASLVAKAATLGLTTQNPSVGSSSTLIDYFEFGTDGDLSSFGGLIDISNGLSPLGHTEFSLGIGFSLIDPVNGASGGFDITDENGLFLAGDLAAVGFTENVIEFQFNHLTGPAANNFGSSVLMLISFADQLGANPFAALLDGNFYEASINIASVVTVPEPQTVTLSALALALMTFSRRKSS